MSVIALGADHAGWQLKEDLKAWLVTQGHQVLDFGTHGSDSVDYPDYALPVAESVAAAKADRGVLVCGTGLGMSMTANKVPRVRAAACGDPLAARLSREHNDANVLALGARLVARDPAIEDLRPWRATAVAGGRQAGRAATSSDRKPR